MLYIYHQKTIPNDYYAMPTRKCLISQSQFIMCIGNKHGKIRESNEETSFFSGYLITFFLIL